VTWIRHCYNTTSTSKELPSHTRKVFLKKMRKMKIHDNIHVKSEIHISH